MENTRNLFITFALSFLVIVGWQKFYIEPRVAHEQELARIEAERQQGANPAAQPGAAPQPQAAGGAAAPQPGAPAGPVVWQQADREKAIGASQRLKIETSSLSGSINLVGGRLDDLRLKHYTETVDPNSPKIVLLNPDTMANGFLVELGYEGDAAAGNMPGPDATWAADANQTLTPTSPVTLTWTNDKGLKFTRVVSVDENYMFTVEDTVANGGAENAVLQGYGLVKRFDKPAHSSTYVLHEGLIGVTGTEGLQEITYKDIESSKEKKPGKSTDGWLGITDKYWAVAIVPSTKQPFQPLFSNFNTPRDSYQAKFDTDAISLAPGQSTTLETLVFAGAKEVAKIDAYTEGRQIRLFDRLIDWGWYPFFTKPMFWLLDTLNKLFSNFGLAILAGTVIIKAIFFPLANMSYKSMANMKKVQPKMQEIREKFADDKMKQQQAMMELYKTEKINPVAGCWPVLLQIPVFFALYKVLYITIEMRHAPFFGWIRDLAAPDPTSLFNLFGLLPYSVPEFLHIGVWPLVMGITMFLQMRMNPSAPDPTQQMIFNWMPVMFTFMLAAFPAGLVIYWAWNNILSVLQQGVIMKRLGVKIELWDNIAGLFKRKKSTEKT